MIMAIRIIDVQDNAAQDRFEVRRRHDDDTETVHIFPRDTLEWRAAEYGIDPADLETLLRIVLYEPFLNHQADDPLHLSNAPSIAAAREHHLKRIRAVADQHPLVDDGGLLDLVRQRAHMHSDVVAMKRTHVERTRHDKATGRALAGDRVEQLRRVLGPAAAPRPPVPQSDLPDTNAVIRSLPGGQG